MFDTLKKIEPIEDNKETMELNVGFVKVINALSDGLQIRDLGVVTQFPDMIKGIDKVPGEIMGMTEDHRQQIRNEIKKLDFGENKSAELIAERAMTAVTALADLAVAIVAGE